MDQNRINWVDTAKGICIIFVVMMHSVLGVEKAVGETGWMHVVVAFAAPFRMPDFFLISGLFLANVIDRSWLRYLDRKVVHFFYFYALWVTIQFAFKAPGFAAEFGLAGTIKLYLMSYIDPFGTLWFIYILPIFFVVTRLARQARVPMWMTGLVAAVLHLANVHSEILLVDEFTSRFVFFFAGYALAPYVFRMAAWVRKDMFVASGLLLSWVLVNGGFVWWGVAAMPVVSLPLGFAGALALICIASLLAGRWAMKPIAWLGANSIVIYLAFFLPMAISRIVLLKLDIISDIGLISLIVTASGVIGSALFYLIIRRLGIGTFLFQRPRWAWLEEKPAVSTLKATTDMRLQTMN
ncbi:MAG: acyltransferase [Hyphomicrobiales bacterium]|nr:acyltransferase family protein [Hyphomicrobiales bacterium]PCJ86535.1 MAG: acyltransferase [Hyphomicrobiales bacterium]